MDSIIANYDEPWQEAISEDFDLFLSFFFPNVYNLSDGSQTPLSLDKELPQITANSDTGKKLADKLFQVWLLDKTEVWILDLAALLRKTVILSATKNSLDTSLH